MGFLALKSKEDKKKESLRGSLSSYPYLLAIKPKEAYLFRSNDYEADGYYFTILSYFHKEGAYDDFGAFWGINRIPSGLEGDVSVTCVETIERMSEGWVKDHQQQAENIAQMNSTEQNDSNSKTNKMRAGKREYDLSVIAEELQAGASYMGCAYRMQVKAKTKELLDAALDAIERVYIDRFSTLYALSYDGEQIGELTGFLRPLSYKKGEPFYMTSTEMAGSYSLVTRGIEDAGGVYIGQMAADVNTAGILFDLNDYKHHIICCSEQIDKMYGRNNVPDLWGSKISQACLLSDHKVAHVILDGVDLLSIGPAFASITERLDMNQGDINMFEMFGDIQDELAAFPMQMQKLILMAEQAYPATDADRAVIRGSLEEIATEFYIQQGMWHDNAGNNRDKLRVVGIPHKDVPKLELFCSYLETEYKGMTASMARDNEKLHAITILRLTFRNMLQNNGDLFNTITTSVIDKVGGSRRVIYDFSKLRKRGVGIMMAQFLNIISFCTGNLGEGDTLFIHGAELIDDTVKDYLDILFSQLYGKGGRVCFLYNNNEKMMNDVSFSGMDKADYTILGTLTDNMAAKYQDVLGQTIPSNLAHQITMKSDSITFLHREYHNMVFNRDLVLFPGDENHRIPLEKKKKHRFFERGSK